MARKTKTTAKKPASKKTDTKPAAKAEPAAAAAPTEPLENAQFGILVQFVKDVSFENPNAPMTLQVPGDNPKLEVNVRVDAIKHTEDVCEVDIHFEAKAESDVGVIYNVEVVYATLFRVMNIPDDMLRPVLFVDGPTIMFPYLRRVVSDLTRDGGYQPLLVDPIDFAMLFQKNGEKAVVRDLTGAGAGQPA